MAYQDTASEAELQQHGEEKEVNVAYIYLALALAVAAWAAAVVIVGLPGLYIPAVAMVPVCMLTIVRITLG